MYSAPRTCSRAAVRSWIDPGSTPDTIAAGREQRLSVAAVVAGLFGVSQVDGFAFDTGDLLGAAVGSDDGAVQDEIGEADVDGLVPARPGR